MYVIFAPAYTHKSGGCKVLYELDYWLRKSGEESVVATFDRRNYYGDRYNVIDLIDTIKPIRNGATVVYPEIVDGNPFNAKKIVRWILNEPEQHITFTDNEMLWAHDNYSEMWATKGNVLTIPFVDLDICKDMNFCRKGSAYWVYKGRNLPRLPQYEDGFPLDSLNVEPKELYKLFNSIEVLYTYDDYTSVADEARLCGTPVICLNMESTRKDYTMKEHPYHYFGYGYGIEELPHAKETLYLFRDAYANEFHKGFDKQLEKFIRETK